MHTPSPCSNGSPLSRLEWRPSRLQALAEAAVLLAAPWLLAASDLPARWRPPVLLALWLAGLGLLWHHLSRPPRRLWLPAAPRPLLLDGQALETPALHVRGPWLQLRWKRPGQGGCLLFWPDTLCRDERRELRLAVRARQLSREARSVAP